MTENLFAGGSLLDLYYQNSTIPQRRDHSAQTSTLDSKSSLLRIFVTHCGGSAKTKNLMILTKSQIVTLTYSKMDSSTLEALKAHIDIVLQSNGIVYNM